jgi:glycosyltransferase involved in cell wall biosynthesis
LTPPTGSRPAAVTRAAAAPFLGPAVVSDRRRRSGTARGVQGDRRIRILHLISTLEAGGTELAMIRLIRSLDPMAYRFRVAWLRGAVALDREIETATDAPPLPIGLRAKIDPRALLRLCRLVRQEGFDLVHTHMDLADYYGAAAARFMGTALVSSKQNADEFRTRRTWKRPPFLLLERASYASADAVIAVSHGLVDFLEKAEALPRHKTVVIGNGVDPAIAYKAPSRDEARRLLGLSPRTPVLGTAGRLAEQKGQIDLLRAMPPIRAALPGACLLIAGEGPWRGTLEEEARRLGLAEAVRFLGHRKDVLSVLRSLDLFVLPSLWEGLPQALLEAMVLSLPVVATRCVGVEETVTDGETGRLVPQHDPEAIAAAAIDVLRDETLGRRLGEAGRTMVLERHAQDKVAAQVDRLYRDILERRR